MSAPILLVLALASIQGCLSAPPPTDRIVEESTPTATTQFAVQQRAQDKWSTLAEIGIWIALLVFVGAAITLIVELLKRYRDRENEKLKRYSFHVNSINERLFEEELNL